MTTYVYRPDHPLADDLGFVTKDQAYDYSSGSKVTSVISDTMEPTRHMADGKMYDSKAKFRAATKAAGCIEVGNEAPTLLKPRAPTRLDSGQRRDAIRKAIYELRNK